MRNADKIIIGLLIALIIGAGYFQYLADELNKRMDEIKTIDQKLVDRVEDQFADSLRQYNLRFIGRGKHIRKAQADIIENTDLIIKNTDSLLSLIDDVDFKLDNFIREPREILGMLQMTLKIYLMSFVQTLEEPSKNLLT